MRHISPSKPLYSQQVNQMFARATVRQREKVMKKCSPLSSYPWKFLEVSYAVNSSSHAISLQERRSSVKLWNAINSNSDISWKLHRGPNKNALLTKKRREIIRMGECQKVFSYLPCNTKSDFQDMRLISFLNSIFDFETSIFSHSIQTRLNSPLTPLTILNMFMIINVQE